MAGIYQGQLRNCGIASIVLMCSLPVNNSINVDDHHQLASPSYALDDLWSLLADDNIFLTIEDYDSLAPNIFHEKENSSLAKGSTDEGLLENRIETHMDKSSPVPLERTILPFDGYDKTSSEAMNSCVLLEQETSTLATTSIENGIIGKQLNARTRKRNRRFKPLQTGEKVVQHNIAEEGSVSKKEEHNAKEKVRRMKLNATFLALGALLPADSRRKMKRRSAPYMIDRALEYIPELESEIENLTLWKNNLLSTFEKKQNLNQNSELEHQAPTVSLHEIVKGEVIIQICTLEDQDTVFSKVLQNVEAAGMCIMSASTLQVCNERVCYHLHIKMNGNSLVADYVAGLRERVISWLI